MLEKLSVVDFKVSNEKMSKSSERVSLGANNQDSQKSKKEQDSLGFGETLSQEMKKNTVKDKVKDKVEKGENPTISDESKVKEVTHDDTANVENNADLTSQKSMDEKAIADAANELGLTKEKMLELLSLIEKSVSQSDGEQETDAISFLKDLFQQESFNSEQQKALKNFLEQQNIDVDALINTLQAFDLALHHPLNKDLKNTSPTANLVFSQLENAGEKTNHASPVLGQQAAAKNQGSDKNSANTLDSDEGSDEKSPFLLNGKNDAIKGEQVISAKLENSLQQVSKPQTINLDKNVLTTAIQEAQLKDKPAEVTEKTVTVNTPVANGKAWALELNDKVAWLASKGNQVAKINLTPRELGPINISIKVSQDTASVQFNSALPQVRELIENALPKLRELMGEQGITLGDVNVSDNSEGAFFADDSRQRESSGFSGNEDESEAMPQVSDIKVNQGQGLVDLFA